MYLTLSTIGQQAIMDAKEGGYQLEIGTARLFRTGTPTNAMPLPLTTALLDANVQASWTVLATNISAIDEFSPVSPDIFHVVVNLPTTVGDFEFDAIGIYLSNGTLLGMGTYERLIPKITLGANKTSNALELEVFIRHASIATLIKVTREKALRPYSKITEVDKADLLGNVADNSERIYRVTRPSNALGANKNAFTTFLVHGGMAYFDNQNKDYQKNVWVPSDHLTMFGSDTLSCRLVSNNIMSLRVPKNQYPMIEHIQTEVPYLIATTNFGNNTPPGDLRGLLLEATLNVVAEGDTYYEIVLLLTHSTFPDTSLRNIDFGAVLYASNTDLSAQEAVRVALRKFLEMQYYIGRTYKSDQPTDPNDVLMPFLGYRTYWQKLNGIVEASTSTTDGRMASAGQIYDLPDYATGGETLLAPVLRATNIWLRYDPSGSGAITYDLTADRTSVNEGGNVRFTLRTTGLTNGSQVAYGITGIQQEDLSSGSLSGYFTINNNVGVLDFNIALDETTEGEEDMRLYIVQDPTVFKVVTIQDTSTSLNVVSYFAVSPTANSGITQMNEGDTRYFVAQVGGIPDGTYLYPMILQSSVADVYDLSQSIPNSVRVTDGRVSFPITAVEDKQTEGDELLTIGLFRDAQHTDSLVSASVLIKDTSRASTARMYFADAQNGNNDISNTTVNEGAYVYLIIETTGYAPNASMALRYGNSSVPSALEVDEADFASTRPTTVTLDVNGRAVVAYAIANDYAKDREDPLALETFNVELTTVESSTILARTMIFVKDTSTLENGAFTITDITTTANPVVVYNSNIDSIAQFKEGTANGTGVANANMILGTIAPLDIGLQIGRRYRLTWIQSETASNAVTRAVLNISLDMVKNFGVGIGSQDTNTTTAGKPLSMIKDSNNTTLGYGAVFEFEVIGFVGPVGISQASVSAFTIEVYYPNGAPGVTYPPNYVPTIKDNWVFAKQTFMPLRDNGSVVKIKNNYTTTTDPKYGFMGKEITVPFGSVVDILVISQSGSGGTSSLATSGSGVDGENGRKIDIHIPKYLGEAILMSNQPMIPVLPEGEVADSITIDKDMLWDSLLVITGGTKGRSQTFDQAQTNLGGVSGNYTYDPNKDVALADLAEGKLFARSNNASMDYEVVCEVIHVITGKNFQRGQSSNLNQDGGLGLLPFGSANTTDNIRGKGGKGGASIGTGYGYAGGGGAGSMYVIRIGTKVLNDNFIINPVFAPVSFFLTDADALALPTTDPLPKRTPFNKAQPSALAGANVGTEGSDLHVSQLNYAVDGFDYLETETLIGSGSPQMFVRPTHNELAVPTLPLKTQTDWDSKQFAQLAISKFGVSRIVLLPTGVEGSYTNAESETVNGLASKPTNLMLYSTLEPNGTPNETKGSTFVYVASANANISSSPVLNKTKLTGMLNTSLLLSTVKNGNTATTDLDNELSRGGYVELYIANNSTIAKAFIAELPRVNISNDNPLKVVDEVPYDEGKQWSNTLDDDGNSLSSNGYNIALGDGALSHQRYVLSNVPSIRPWIKLPAKPMSMEEKNVPIIIQQGQSVTLTIVGGGGDVSTREPDAGVTTPDVAFNGTDLVLSLKAIGADTFTDFLTCKGGTGSIDNSTNPVASSVVATLDTAPLAPYLNVIGTPTLSNGTDNPIKNVHGGVGSGSYAKVTLMNYYPHPVLIRASGGRGGSGLDVLQVSDGIVMLTVN